MVGSSDWGCNFFLQELLHTYQKCSFLCKTQFLLSKPGKWDAWRRQVKYNFIQRGWRPLNAALQYEIIIKTSLLTGWDQLEEEHRMFEATDSAVSNLTQYLAQNKIESAVRIALMQGGWSGPSLGLALDESKENDKIFEEGALKFLVEDDLLERCGSIKVDFVEAGYRSGFSITSTNPLGGGSCSSGSCGGSCG